MGTGTKLLTAFIVVESFTLPIFRSGGRTGLTFWGWIIAHTVFGPPVQYVPEEDYTAELEGVSRKLTGHLLMGPALESATDGRREATSLQ